MVTAYDEGTKREGIAADGTHQLLYGKEAAESAMQVSLAALGKSPEKNIKEYQERIVSAGPAEALLHVAGDNPKNLIVVGNRGLGAAEGELLGSVPAEVVRRAVCKVMIVQTTRHAEDLAAMTSVMEIKPGDTLAAEPS